MIRTLWFLALLAFRHLFIAVLAFNGGIWFDYVSISCSPGVLWKNGVGFKMISHPRMLFVDRSVSPFSNWILPTYVHPYPLPLSTHNISNRQMSWTFYSFSPQYSLWVSVTTTKKGILVHICQVVMHSLLVIHNKHRWYTSNLLLSWGVILFYHLSSEINFLFYINVVKFESEFM